MIEAAIVKALGNADPLIALLGVMLYFFGRVVMVHMQRVEKALYRLAEQSASAHGPTSDTPRSIPRTEVE